MTPTPLLTCALCRPLAAPVVLILAAVGLVACERGDSAGPAGATAGATWSASTHKGRYQLKISPREGAALIGQFQDWVIEVRDASGNAQHPVSMSIDGGMPEHGHGLPTRPEIGEYLGDGRYLIEGLRFNMAGGWIVQVALEGPAGPDTADLELALTFQ